MHHDGTHDENRGPTKTTRRELQRTLDRALLRSAPAVTGPYGGRKRPEPAHEVEVPIGHDLDEAEIARRAGIIGPKHLRRGMHRSLYR